MASDGKERMPMRGVFYALLASVLFGLTTPFSKGLLGQIDPVLLAGLFYLGSGIGLTTVRFLLPRLRGEEVSLPRLQMREWAFLAPAIIAGGVVAPVLLMSGLVNTPGSTASLLLNTEGVFTAFIAWMIFKENYDRRILIGMLAIIAGGIVLSVTSAPYFLPSIGSLLIIGACLCWGIDNNLTRKISGADAALIASYKGLVAGAVNTCFAITRGSNWPGLNDLFISLTIGFLGYGISLVLYVLALRHIGAARTGAYFAVAPFVGALVSVLMFREAVTVQLIAAGVLMGIGLWLHLTEHHAHEHVHERVEHEHEHVYDEHHQHEHLRGEPLGEPHVHTHTHERVVHDHPHFPDQHHSHDH
jgi:drug/metabolite transporter (DMT)-like permease